MKRNIFGFINAATAFGGCLIGGGSATHNITQIVAGSAIAFIASVIGTVLSDP